MKKPGKKTTLNIDPADMGPFHDLALALGQTQRYGRKVMGSNTKLVRYIMELVKATDADTVAASLTPERLAEVVEGMQEENDESSP